MGVTIEEIAAVWFSCSPHFQADFAQWTECVPQIENEMQSGNKERFYNAVFVLLVRSR